MIKYKSLLIYLHCTSLRETDFFYTQFNAMLITYMAEKQCQLELVFIVFHPAKTTSSSAIM